MTTALRDVGIDFSRDDYFKDHSQFGNNRSSKRAPSSPDFRHKQVREPLWIDAWHNQPWVKEDLRRQNGEFCVQKVGVEGTTCQDLSSRTALFDLIKACGKKKDLLKGSMVHADILARGLLEQDIFLRNAVLSMYVKCGALAQAQEMFDELPLRNNVVTWNALISGYAQNGLGGEALRCFRRMRGEGPSPDAVTYICILKACSSIGAVEEGEEIHADVVRQALLESNIVLGTALVDMYAKCGALSIAQQVFNELLARDVALWNVLITGYAQQGLGNETLSFFEQMQEEGFSPNVVTFTGALKACGSIGAAKKGEEIHGVVERQGLLGKDIVLGTALVDMYVKCGALSKAQEVFDELPARDVATWTALLAGYAQVGKVETAFNTFERMIGEGIKPNMVTFVVLLNACSHAGLVEEGQVFFETMRTFYCIIPTIEHRTCMVDIFSRAGHVEKAISMIEKAPSSDCLLLLSAVMGACRKGQIVELGRWAFDHAVQVDENFSELYVCMSNMYVAAGMQEEADKVES